MTVVVGLMSGTSLDGISAAVVRFARDGARITAELLAYDVLDYDDAQRDRLARALREGTPEEYCRVNFDLGELLASAAVRVIAESGVPRREVAAIATHGQTVWHVPGHSTWQIGESSVIAERWDAPSSPTSACATWRREGRGPRSSPWPTPCSSARRTGGRCRTSGGSATSPSSRLTAAWPACAPSTRAPASSSSMVSRAPCSPGNATTRTAPSRARACRSTRWWRRRSSTPTSAPRPPRAPAASSSPPTTSRASSPSAARRAPRRARTTSLPPPSPSPRAPLPTRTNASFPSPSATSCCPGGAPRTRRSSRRSPRGSLAGR
ncbi:MAG: anhydro-N-acetylmuramic acid kinase [Gemmatimonadetes bacterium]|nr:anhydro-N-acetylmuramic acid kinase [Gemmatimonadota bacterium]